MNTDHLQYFLTAVDLGSINKASEQLMLKQPYLSNVIKNLEQQIGTKLIERTSKGIYLTEDGKYLIDKIRTICDTASKLQESYHFPSSQKYRNATTHIHIYIPPQVGKFGTIVETSRLFKETFPNSHLTIQSKGAYEVMAALTDPFFQFGIVASSLPTTQLRAALPEDIGMQTLQMVECVAISSHTNQESQQYQSISCSELLTKELIAFCPEGNPENSTTYQILKLFGTPVIQYVTDNYAIFFDLIRNSSCYSILERRFAREHDLHIIPLRDTIFYRTILFYRKSLLENFVVKSFYEMLLKANR